MATEMNKFDVLKLQRQRLDRLQALTRKPLLIKVKEGSTPEGEDSRQYQWLHYKDVWADVKEPIYTRGILENEIVFDPDVRDYSVMRKEMEKLKHYCDRQNIPYELAYSGGKGCHMHIFFDALNVGAEVFDKAKELDVDLYKCVREGLAEDLLTRAGANPDRMGLDWGKIRFRTLGSMGSMVREYGTTRSDGKSKTLIDDIPGTKPEDLPLRFPTEPPKLWNISDTVFHDAIQQKIRIAVEQAETRNEHSLDSIDFAGTDIMSFPCVQKIIDSKLETGRYYAASGVALLCKQCGYSRADTEKTVYGILDTFKGLTQSERELRLQNSLKMYESDHRFSCRTLKDKVGDYVCDYGRCPLKQKINDWKTALESIPKPTETATSEERYNGAKEFTKKYMSDMDPILREAICKNEVVEHFGVTKKTMGGILASLFPKGGRKRRTEEEEEELSPLDVYPDDVLKQAYDILEHGDPMTYILDEWNKGHVGDRKIGEIYACSAANVYILNAKWGNIKPNGSSGMGKSDSGKKFLKYLPAHRYTTGSLSGKALFYDKDMKEGTIIFSDDVRITEDITDLIKQCDFQTGTKHKTVKDQQNLELTIPARCPFWLNSVESFDDEQLSNRFIGVGVDESPEQDERVFKKQIEEELTFTTTDSEETLICRCMYDIIGQEVYDIRIPFLGDDRLTWRNQNNRRNLPMLLDIIRSVTLYKIKQREKVGNCYLATVEDFERAIKIYKNLAESNYTNLSEKELKVMRYISQKKGSVDRKEITLITGKTQSDTVELMHGDPKKGTHGLLGKVPGLWGEQDDKRKWYYYYSGKYGLDSYDEVAVLDREGIEVTIYDFKTKLLARDGYTFNTQLTPSLHPQGVSTISLSEDNNTNSLTPIKRDIQKKINTQQTVDNNNSHNQNVSSKTHSHICGVSEPKNRPEDTENQLTPMGVSSGVNGVSEVRTEPKKSEIYLTPESCAGEIEHPQANSKKEEIVFSKSKEWEEKNELIVERNLYYVVKELTYIIVLPMSFDDIKDKVKKYAEQSSCSHKHCVHCGSPDAPNKSISLTGDVVYRCVACYRVYSNPPPIKEFIGINSTQDSYGEPPVVLANDGLDYTNSLEPVY
jgi:hypothetical protein